MKIIRSLLLVTLFFGCTQEEVTPRPYPRVGSVSVDGISVNGFNAKGEITYSSVEITDHGFTWKSTTNPTLEFGKVISLGAKSGAGTFRMEADTLLEKGKTYYIRSYAKSADYIVYGDQLSFIIN